MWRKEETVMVWEDDNIASGEKSNESINSIYLKKINTETEMSKPVIISTDRDTNMYNDSMEQNYVAIGAVIVSILIVSSLLFLFKDAFLSMIP